MTILKV